jgi:hypothetical protein
MNISEYWDFSNKEFVLFKDNAESLGIWMPIPIINAPDLTKGDNSKPSSFVAFNFMDILDQSLLKHTRAHALAVNKFGSYDWLVMNLEFDIWVAWLSPVPIRKNLEFSIPRFCYNGVGKYNSSKKIVDNSDLIFKSTIGCNNFWGHLFMRFNLQPDKQGSDPLKDKIFTMRKVYYETFFTRFYREYTFVIENDYITIITHLLVRHRKLDQVRVTTPFIQKGQLFENWKIYVPFCQEMIVWFFEFYSLFDQFSWEIPQETIGNGPVSLMPGFVEQSIGPKGSLKGVSISKMDVDKRLIEGMVEKERNWKDKQLLSKKEKEDFKTDNKVGAVCVVCSRPSMLCKCGEISKEELDFGNSLINKIDKRLSKQPTKVDKLRETLRISDLDFANLLTNLKNKQLRLENDENHLVSLGKVPSDYLPKGAILDKHKDWNFRKDNSQNIPSLIVKREDMMDLDFTKHKFEVDKLKRIHAIPMSPFLEKEQVNVDNSNDKEFLKEMDSLNSKIQDLEKNLVLEKDGKDKEISQLIKEPFSFGPSQSNIRVNSVNLVKEVNPIPPLNPNPPVPVPPSGLIELSGDEKWTEVIMTKSMPDPNHIGIPFQRPSNKEIDNDNNVDNNNDNNNNINNNNNLFQAQRFIPSMVRSSGAKLENKNNLNWSNPTPPFLPSSNQLLSSSKSVQTTPKVNTSLPSLFSSSPSIPKT